MILRLARRLRPATRDEGYALPVVMGLGLLMLTLVATSVSVTLSGEQKSKTDEEWNAALAAAYAGIEDYKSRLENDVSYSRYGNPSAPFSTQSTGLSLPTGTSANKAFSITLNADWAIVPGSDDIDIPGTREASFFRYEVDNSRYGATGVIRIRSTGRVGDETRSVISDLRQEGFNDYVYFTDYEVQDPIISGESSNCEAYAWVRSGCADIQFAAVDVLRGKVHSNDRIVVCGATFKGGVTTASTTTPRYKIASNCSDGVFEAGKPVKVDKITMPPSNDQMRKETRNDLPSEVPSPGCLYTGPTSIKLNNNGTMTVISPWTKKTQIAATKAGATSPAMCGTPGTLAGQLGHPDGATISVLNHNLIYVQNVTSDTTNDPNGWLTTDKPSGFTCSDSGNKYERWAFGTLAYRATGEDTPFTSTAANPAYGCRKGDLYTSGVLKGQMTMAAMNFIYIVGDITYADNQQDVLGLVGENAVWIWNPMKSTTGTSTTTDKSDDSGTAILPKNRTIYAAILSVKHTIQVQNYHVGGARGVLKIVGSMAQKFRGTVGTGAGANGFSKDYGYDLRLTYLSPPKYLTPTSTTFDTTQIAGVPAAFSPNGGATMSALVGTLAGATGLAIGSFLNVVAYRVPAGLSVVRPASACPGCGQAIRRRDNIPVLSWLLLGGRCRDCRMRISARYPIVEAITGLAFVAVALAFAPGILNADGGPELATAIVTLGAYLYLAAISVVLAVIDLDVHRLPNPIVYPAYAVGAVFLTTAALLAGEPVRIIQAAVGAGALFLFYFLLAVVYPGGMGFGDVKLAGVLGLFLGFLGWGPLLVGAATAFLLGGVFGIALLVAGRAHRGRAIPFGPWMVVGAWIGIFAGDPLATGYLKLVGLS